MTQTPSIGRIVHFIVPFGAHAGEHRAAIITGVDATHRVNLTIFLDSQEDRGPYVPHQPGDTSWTEHHVRVDHDPTGLQRGTWHWPEQVGPTGTARAAAAAA